MVCALSVCCGFSSIPHVDIGRLNPPLRHPNPQVLTPSPKDEARRARVGKLLEQVGLQYTGEALFASNRCVRQAAEPGLGRGWAHTSCTCGRVCPSGQQPQATDPLTPNPLPKPQTPTPLLATTGSRRSGTCARAWAWSPPTRWAPPRSSWRPATRATSPSTRR